MQNPTPAPVQVKILRFGDLKSGRGAGTFVGKVLSTNATLSFQIRAGYMLPGREGDVVAIDRLGSTAHQNSKEHSYVPIACCPLDSFPSDLDRPTLLTKRPRPF